MASETFQFDNTTTHQTKIATLPEDTMDDITEQAGANRNPNGGQMTEKLVKWQIPGSHDMVSAKKILGQLLATLLVNHPNEVTLIDRKQREWNYDETQNENDFLQEFETVSIQLHALRKKDKSIAKWTSITRFNSISNPQDWKNNDPFYALIAETKTYIFPHPFGIDDWDIVNVGFIRNIHAVHYPREVLHQQITQLLIKHHDRVPTFQVIPQTITTADKTATTKAYSVQCLKDDATTMIQMLTHGVFREPPNQIFVPFKYKNTKPEIFTKCIRQQNSLYHKTWIIKLEGISRAAMPYIESDITNIMGVWHIVPTKRTDQIGEWKILTDQSKCAYIHRQLSTHWSSIISKIPEEVLQMSPTQYSIPAISSKRARDYQDNESDGDSYGSLLTTGTEVSAMTAEDNSYNELPTEYSYPSYAQAAMASTNSVGDTRVSSPTTSTYPEWQKERQELEAKIRDHALQIEKLQADIQAKISRSQDLEEQLAQAIELAHSRDARHEEMLEKFEHLMRIQQSLTTTTSSGQQSPYLTQEEGNPTTPDRLMTTLTEPPPQKKANTNPSPDRNIYAMFRPTSGKPQSQKPASTFKIHRSKPDKGATTQPMDTDESHPKPPPGAPSGKDKE